MSDVITLTSIVSPTIKNGQLEKDDKGYYLVNLGGFNIFNRHNEFYRVNDIDKLLKDERGGANLFLIRMKEGYLTGEAGHPVYKAGMSPADWFSRNVRLDVTNVSHHIRDVFVERLNEAPIIPGSGPAYRIKGWVKPSGKHGAALQSVLDNPDMNVAFSIRCLTKDTTVNGYKVRDVKEIITWDWVDVPGISKANKWSTIAHETINYGEVFIDDLLKDERTVEELSIAFEDHNAAVFQQSLKRELESERINKTTNYFKNW